MAVVINELEVTPAAPARPGGGVALALAPQGAAPVTAEVTQELEKALRRKHERMHRLTAC